MGCLSVSDVALMVLRDSPGAPVTPTISLNALRYPASGLAYTLGVCVQVYWSESVQIVERCLMRVRIRSGLCSVLVMAVAFISGTSQQGAERGGSSVPRSKRQVLWW